MSGAVQAGQRAALEVLAELYPLTLTQEEQEAVQHSLTVKDPVEQTPTFQLTYFSTTKAIVIAPLAIGAVLFLAQNQNARLMVKTYLANAFF